MSAILLLLFFFCSSCVSSLVRCVVLVSGQSAITGDEDNASVSASDSGRLLLEN